MNTTTAVLALLGVGLAGGIAYAATREDEEESAQTGPELPPINLPPGPVTTPPIGNLPPGIGTQFNLPSVPPSDWPIPGGIYIDYLNKWCPPGYQYNSTSSMCDPIQGNIYVPSNPQQVNFTQGCKHCGE